MRADTIRDWADMLRRRADSWREDAASTPGAHPPRSSAVGGLFAETAFLIWRERRALASGDPLARLPEVPASARGDAALWWAVAGAAIDPDAVLLSSGPGPMFPQDRYDTIEVWTESDLSAMQAAWWLARLHARPDWRRRALDAAEWHLENIQPDNATNRPWAIAVFLDLWRHAGVVEARLFAETLLHNAEAGSAARSRLGAELLADAADAAALLAED